ncbi:MAG: class I SAM-dependent methyltransferase, partial [Magnetococcales bacterium]|nr:class I SAM-dependent methyltransferase [Magnetococcales bacterium]
WYHTPQGAWMALQEENLLLRMLNPAPGTTLLDVGCGTGFFSRRLAASGLRVVGMDSDQGALDFAVRQGHAVRYVAGDARAMPFPDRIFDNAMAVTSLCFVTPPAVALTEMLRVTRQTVILGLLNRKSLLYLRKKGSSGYTGARWDEFSSVQAWMEELSTAQRSSWRVVSTATAIHWASGIPPVRWLEGLCPDSWPFGGFLAIKLVRT